MPFDSDMKFITSMWMTVVVGAVLYVGATFLFWKTPSTSTAPSESPAPVAPFRGPSWDFTNPEAEQLMQELHEEKVTLRKREQELNELSARLQAERTEMNQVTQSVHESQMNFDKLVTRVQDEETANLKKLAKVYAAMAPDSAATIFTSMDDAAVVKIMLYMKEAETAAVWESFAKKGTTEARRAAELSERVRTSVFRGTNAVAAAK